MHACIHTHTYMLLLCCKKAFTFLASPLPPLQGGRPRISHQMGFLGLQGCSEGSPGQLEGGREGRADWTGGESRFGFQVC